MLAALDDEMADAWQTACGAVPGVSIHRGNILDVPSDAVVSPANSFGFMDGGIDMHYSRHFGWGLQTKLRTAILEKHHGELLVGQAEIVETGDMAHPFLIAAPTMRVPMVLGDKTIHPYLATRAVLRLLKSGRFASGENISDHVATVSFPGMGTGVGRVPPAVCARQMRQAIEDVLIHPVRLPTSWAEASENHQLLYTDKPVRLQ